MAARAIKYKTSSRPLVHSAFGEEIAADRIDIGNLVKASSSIPQHSAFGLLATASCCPLRADTTVLALAVGEKTVSAG